MLWFVLDKSDNHSGKNKVPKFQMKFDKLGDVARQCDCPLWKILGHQDDGNKARTGKLKIVRKTLGLVFWSILC